MMTSKTSRIKKNDETLKTYSMTLKRKRGKNER